MKKDTENNSVSFLFGECNVTIFAPGKNIGCFLRCEEESYCIGVRYIGLGIAEFTMMGILPMWLLIWESAFPWPVISFLRMRWVFVLVHPCCSWPANVR